MALGKHSVPGSPTNLDNSRARANCTRSRCGWALFDFFSRLSFSFLCPSLGDGLIQTEILSERAVEPKTTNHSSYVFDLKETFFLNAHSKLAINIIFLYCKTSKN